MATVELDFRAVASKAIKDIDSLNKRVDKLGKNTNTTRLAFAGILANLGTAAISGMGSAISKTITEARKMEDITAQFETLTGSATIAKATMQDLADFTSRTPFQLEQVAKAGKTLLAFGTNLKEVKPLLQDLGDVSAATGASLSELTLIHSQIRAEGKLTNERWRQMAERGIVLDDIFAKKLGVSSKEVRKEISKGRVSFEMFNEAFKSLNEEGGIAAGGMDRLASTLSGKISTLTDNIDLFAAAVGGMTSGVLKDATDELNKFFVAMTQQVKETPLRQAQNDLVDLQAKMREMKEGGSIVDGILGTMGFGDSADDLQAKIEKKIQEVNELAKAEAEANEKAEVEKRKKAKADAAKLAAQKEADRNRELKANGTFYSNWKSFVTDFKTFEESTGKERIANMRSTLGTISTLTSSNNKTLFRVGQASAIATATVDGITAVQKALASAPPPFNFILAGLVGTATALNVQKIASAKPPAYEQGGVVGGSSYTGDNVLAAVNSNEVILNGKQQAETLFQIANGGLQGNNAVDAINALGDRIANLEVVVMTSDIEIARSVNRAVDNGFQLKGAA